MIDRLAVLIVEHKASDDSRIGNPCREPSGRMSIDLEFAIMPWSQATQGMAILGCRLWLGG
jgi:hypothetical protein